MRKWMIPMAIVVAAIVIIIATRSTPSRLRYEAELERVMASAAPRHDATIERMNATGFDRYAMSQPHGQIAFLRKDTPVLIADMQFAGSHSRTTGTWLWAWDNESIDANLRADSLRVKAYGEQRGLRELTTGKWETEESTGWELAAFQLHIAGGEGIYSFPFSQGRTFVTLKNLRAVQPGEQVPFLPKK